MMHEPAGFFALRSPLLPYDELAGWSEGLRAPAALAEADDLGSTVLDVALAADRATLRDRLRVLVERPEVREALFLASPALQGSFETWLREPDGRRGQRVERALVRYLERMAARSTPFGLFAGCAVGTVGAETCLTLTPRSAYRRHTRLDMHYLCGLVRALEADETIRPALRFRPSSSLAWVAGRWRWIELTPDDPAHSHRHHRLDASPALDALIEQARSGLTLGALAAALAGTVVPEEPESSDRAVTPGLPLARSAGEGVGGRGLSSAQRLDWLVQRALLVSELEPAVTGPEPIHGLIERLEMLGATVPAAAQAAETLRAVRDAVADLDAAGLGVDAEPYQRVVTRLGGLPGPLDPAKLWQGELIKTVDDPADTGDLTLGADVLAELERGARLLQRLHRPGRDSLARFREAFIARYEGIETRREVPLAEALDPELGISFGPSTGHDGSAPLLEGLDLPARTGDTTIRTGDRFAFLFGKLAEALATGASEIVLTDADLDRLANPEPLPLPDAISVTASLAAASPAALAAGQFRLLLDGIAGPSGARLAGRFCHGDPALRARVAAYLQAEEALRPDVVFAEIAHLPEPRTGNVVHRPVFREHEIVYLGASGVPLERQIPLDDLRVAVVGERIVLRSARLGREVVPRLTCAQNYFHPRTTSIYRFLAALQDQGVGTGLGWDWGPLAQSPMLPRVRTGRLVLARARWRLDQEETKLLGAATGAELYRLARDWRTRRGIPRHARLAEYDNELLIDFDNVLSVESFAQLLKGRASATLVELFPGPDDLCASGPEGRFFHELSVPFIGVGDVGSRVSGDGERGSRAEDAGGARARPSEESTGAAALPHRPPPSAHHRRSFPLGSEWLYAKLYTPPSAVDGLLREVVRPLVDRAIGSGAADGWFFIRYGDPEWHLRLRFHGEPGRLHAEVLPLLQQAVVPLLDGGQIRRFQLDTYERELERYGGPAGMPLCEQVFQVDSQAVLETVVALDDESLPAARWKLAVAGMDVLLEGLGLALAERLAVLRMVRDSFNHEHHADQKLLRQIGERFRVERANVEGQPGAAAGAGDPDDPTGRAAAAFPRMAARLAPIMEGLRAAAGRGELSLALTELAPSLLHMHANRLLRSDQRRQELVLYDFLYRLYDARQARARGSAGRPDPVPRASS